MADKKDIYFYLNKKEDQVMKVLWKSKKPLSAKEIASQINTDWANKSIQSIIKKLESKNAIRVVDIVRVYKSNARLFEPTISSDEYATMQFNKYYNSNKEVPFILSALIDVKDIDSNLPKVLEELLEKFKEE